MHLALQLDFFLELLVALTVLLREPIEVLGRFQLVLQRFFLVFLGKEDCVLGIDLPLLASQLILQVSYQLIFLALRLLPVLILFNDQLLEFGALSLLVSKSVTGVLKLRSEVFSCGVRDFVGFFQLIQLLFDVISSFYFLIKSDDNGFQIFNFEFSLGLVWWCLLTRYFPWAPW